MSKKKEVKKVKGKGGPKPKYIDWTRVEQLLIANCSGVEIAAYMGVHYDTFYNRCEKEFGISFTEYSQEKKRKGCSLLKAKQFEVAMNGDKSMLIWLGKNRLGQSDKIEQVTELTSNNVNIYIPDNGRNDGV